MLQTVAESSVSTKNIFKVMSNAYGRFSYWMMSRLEHSSGHAIFTTATNANDKITLFFFFPTILTYLIVDMPFYPLSFKTYLIFC